MNALTIAREEAAKLEVKLDDATLESLVWEQTGWPGFFAGDDPEAEFRRQLQAAMQPIVTAQRSRDRRELQEKLPTKWELLLEDDQ